MFAVLCLYVLLLPFITTAAFSGVINDDDDSSLLTPMQISNGMTPSGAFNRGGGGHSEMDH